MIDRLNMFLDFYKKKLEEAKQDLNIAKLIQKDLIKKLPKTTKYFKAYEPSSVENMLGDYAFMRMQFTKLADFFQKRADEINSPYLHDAEEKLQWIQQKKLFNIQCLWRAGRIKDIKEVETTYDFLNWQYDIYNCPFLPPIEQKEVDLLIRFFKDTPVQVQSESAWEHCDWQNYMYIKASFAERENIELQEFYKAYSGFNIFGQGVPPWYDYFDSFMNTEGLVALDDIKFPKEMEYTKIYNEYEQKKKIEEDAKAGIIPVVPVMKKRKPYIGSDYDKHTAIKEFVDEFETPENKKGFINYALENFHENDEDEMIDEELECKGLLNLDMARTPVPIEENEDWRKAVIIAQRKLKYESIVKAIPTAYDNYLMRLETGIGFPSPDEKSFSMKDTIRLFKEHILEARKLLGEPEDFNF